MTRWRRGLLVAWLLSLMLAGGDAARAQTATPSAAPSLGQAALAAMAPAAPAPAPVSAAELQRLVDTLQDDAARGRLVDQLRALIAVERGIEQKTGPPGPAVPIAVANPVTALQELSHQVDAIAGEILAAATVVVDAPRFVEWLKEQVSDEAKRRWWLEILLELAAIFGAAVLAEWLVRRAVAKPRRSLAERPTTLPLVHAALLMLTAAIDVAPILAFAATAYGMMVIPVLHPSTATGYVAEVLIRANVTARLILLVARLLLLSDHAPACRLGIGEETRNYLYIWARRFTGWAVYGFAVPEGAWWLGVPGSIYALLLKGAALVLTVLGVIFVLQNRQAVADWLRGPPEGAAEGEEAAGPAARGRHEGWLVVRQRLADIWHIPTILYVLAIFIVYCLRIEGGFIFVLRASVLSLVVMIAARLLVRAIRRLSRRGFAIHSDLKQRFPTLEHRANRYLPILTQVSSSIIYFFAALTLLQAWGIQAFAWFDSETGRQLTSTLVRLATVVITSIVLWELFSAGIERYLAGIDGDGRKVARSARVRTLLPLLRTATLVVLIVTVTLIVLSELGINTAPLLAGAGVVGLAIGFGSQALVKDVITGLFILIEDTLAVGDVVDVGKGHVGVVEAISIRTIRLRDMSATVHTIPFSEVTTINNMTRGYSYFVADVGVLYREDPDRVMAVLRQVGEELRGDPTLAPYILEALEIVGVDKFTDTAMVIKIRLKTMPLRQWTVGREFNRLMKKAFDAQGIEMPSMNQTRYLPEAPEMAPGMAAELLAAAGPRAGAAR